MKNQNLAKRRQYPVQIKDTMPRISKNIDNGKININICLNWKQIVGDEFAKYLTPVKIQTNNDKKTLWLRCANGASITMSYAQNEIIEKINLFLGQKKINDIRLLPENKKRIPQNLPKQAQNKTQNEMRILIKKSLLELAEKL